MDIVEQLKFIGCGVPQGCVVEGKPSHVCRCIIQNDAADYIERLREALNKILEDEKCGYGIACSVMADIARAALKETG